MKDKEDIFIVIGMTIILVGFFIGILSIPLNYACPLVSWIFGFSLVIGLALMLSSLKA